MLFAPVVFVFVNRIDELPPVPLKLAVVLVPLAIDVNVVPVAG